MRDAVKEHILNNTAAIDANDFDFLADLSLGVKVELAEVFLEAGIDFTNPKPENFHKVASINKFLNDLRIDCKGVVISKGPLKFDGCEISKDQYALKFKFKTIDINTDINLLKKIYNIDSITVGKRWDSRFYTTVLYDIVIINK